jgi:hypothetical protein
MARTKQTARKSVSNGPRLVGWVAGDSWRVDDRHVDGVNAKIRDVLRRFEFKLGDHVYMPEKNIYYFKHNVYELMKVHKIKLNVVLGESTLGMTELRAKKDDAWSSMKDLVKKQEEILKERSVKHRQEKTRDQSASLRRLVDNDFQVMKDSQMMEFTINEADSFPVKTDNEESSDSNDSSGIEDYESGEGNEGNDPKYESDTSNDQSDESHENDQSHKSDESDENHTNDQSDDESHDQSDESDEPKSKTLFSQRAQIASHDHLTQIAFHDHLQESDASSASEEEASPRAATTRRKRVRSNSSSESSSQASAASRAPLLGHDQNSRAPPTDPNPIIETIAFQNGNVWNKHFSKTHGKHYWYNAQTNQSTWSQPTQP